MRDRSAVRTRLRAVTMKCYSELRRPTPMEVSALGRALRSFRLGPRAPLGAQAKSHVYGEMATFRFLPGNIQVTSLDRRRNCRTVVA